MEIWKDIVGYEGNYMVSNLGGVKSIERKCNSKNGKLRTVPGKIMTLLRDKNYYKINLHKNGKMNQFYIHFLVLRSFVPNLDNKKCCNHLDGNKLNNNLSNLEWATYKENNNHAILTGLNDMRGTGNGSSKICDKDVITIRNLAEEGYGPDDISERYPISSGQISRIISRKAWGHI